MAPQPSCFHQEIFVFKGEAFLLDSAIALLGIIISVYRSPALHPTVRALLARLVLFAAALSAGAQQPIALPAFHPSAQSATATFHFVSDGPRGPGWTRPDEVARAYFDRQLPVFFSRTIELDTPLPEHATLDWIFTGPHAGFTVSLSPSSLHVTQRFYNSTGLSDRGPTRTTQDDTRVFTGHARSLTVVLDAHLTLTILINGAVILTQHCVFDITRDQLALHAPRTEHEIIAGHLLREPTASTTLTVDAHDRHQTMLGFGGSPSVPAYASLSDEGKRLYWDIMRRYNLLIDREYPMGTELKPDLSNIDNLADATPHYYGDNFPNGEVSDFDYSRRALQLGGSVIYEMWALPPWATVAWQPPAGAPPLLDAWKKPVRTAADPEVYARIVVGYCRLLQQRSGSAPQIVGIENEVEQAPEVFARMTTILRRELDRAGFASTRIHMADAPYVSMAIDRVKALKSFPDAWKATDFTAAHQYDFQQFLSDPDLYDKSLLSMQEASAGKPFLSTEICLNDGKAQEPSYRIAFQVGQLYHKDLTLVDAEMLLYCWLILDVEQPTFGSSRSLLIPDRTRGDIPVASSFQLRVLGAWSRHIKHGMTRIAVHSADPDTLATAFADGKQTTLVAMNRSTSAKTLQLTWPSAPSWKTIEHTSFYAENQSTAFSASNPITIAPGEILTLTTEPAQ